MAVSKVFSLLMVVGAALSVSAAAQSPSPSPSPSLSDLSLPANTAPAPAPVNLSPELISPSSPVKDGSPTQSPVPATSASSSADLILPSTQNTGMPPAADSSLAPGPSAGFSTTSDLAATPKENGSFLKRAGLAAVGAGLMAVAVVV